jgi:hypothetical protein
LHELYELALSRKLVSKQRGDMITGINFRNLLPIPIRMQHIDGQGVRKSFDRVPNAFTQIAAGANAFTGADFGQAFLGDVYLVTSAFSGGLVGVVQIVENEKFYHIGPPMLTRPNNIGHFPKPTDKAPIPVDSPRVVVACGTAADGKVVAREQFWKRSAESYSLAPKQSHTIGFSVTSGMEETTSQQQTIAASLGLSASAGWGPISASVSASLSRTSTTFQQVTVTQRETRFETIQLTNDTDKTQTLLRWQLTDVITVLDKGVDPVASIVLAQAPALIGGPY